MNPLNLWLKLEQMDEENPRFEAFMQEMNISNRSEVERYASLCAYKIFDGGAAWRINGQLIGTYQKGLLFLRFAGINIDILRFDDYFRTELNTIFLYDVRRDITPEAFCEHCYNEMKYDPKSKICHCVKCDFFVM